MLDFLKNFITNDQLNGVGYFLCVLFLAIGVGLLVYGSDWFVSGASAIAKKLHISPLVIGLTVVSFGTSAPELAVSLTSSIQGESGIAMGNVVGSNIMNLLVVLGVSAAITPIAIKKSICKREFPFLIGATVLLLVFSMDRLFSGYQEGVANILSRGEALIFILGIVAFCYMSIVLAKKDAKVELVSNKAEDDTIMPKQKIKEENNDIKDMPLWKAILILLVGLAGIVIGAQCVTDPAANIAVSLGVTANLDRDMVKNVVGLTVIAIGTSLPELCTSMVAAKKGENDIAIGNVVGSNIFNILFICGLSGFITPLTMTSDIITDMLVSFGATVLVLFFCFKGKITKKNGWGLLAFYAIYLTYIIVRLFVPVIVIPF